MKHYFFWILFGIFVNVYHGLAQEGTNNTETESNTTVLPETTMETATTMVFTTTMIPTTPDTTEDISTTSGSNATMPTSAPTTVKASTTAILTTNEPPTLPDTTTSQPTTASTAEVTPASTTISITAASTPEITTTTPEVTTPMASTSPEITTTTHEVTTSMPLTSPEITTTTHEVTTSMASTTTDEITSQSTITISTTQQTENLTTTTDMGENICEPCVNGNCEQAEIYACVCEDGWYGTNCDMSSVCGESEIFYTIALDCNETSTVENITIYFGATDAGRSASANTTCNTSCVENTVPVAFYECAISDNGHAEWVGYSSIACNERYGDKSTEDKAQFLAISTSDPSTTTSQDVETTVTELEEITSNNLNQSTADDVVITVNNLLLIASKDVQQTVEQSSSSILATIDSTAANVALEDNDDFNSYVQVQSNIAIAVAENAASSRSVSAYGTGDSFYYGSNNSMDGTVNLALASLSLTQSQPSGSYMRASSAGRISFKMYLMSNTFLVSNASITVAQVVFSVQGNGDFTLNFETKDQMDILADGGFKSDATRRVNCAIWNRMESLWEDGDCNGYLASGNFASCLCNKEGEYTMRTIIVEIPVELPDDGLSGGAIAGIVIGSICGVLLITGLIYFVHKRKKENREEKYKPDVQMSNMDIDAEVPSLNGAGNNVYTDEPIKAPSMNGSVNEAYTGEPSEKSSLSESSDEEESVKEVKEVSTKI